MNKKKQEVLITASEYIVKLKLGIKDTAELFQSYDETKGSSLLYEITDGLQWITDALVLTEIINNNEVLEINQKLKEIVEAFENEDYILIGDLLFYEVLPIIEKIETKIKKC